MPLYSSKNLFPNHTLYPSLEIGFDFDGLNDYNSVRASKKNVSLLSDLDNTIIGGKQKKQSLDSSPDNNHLKAKKFEGNNIK